MKAVSVFLFMIFLGCASSDPFKGPVSIRFKNQASKTFDVPKGQIEDHITITTRLKQGQKVNFVVLYGSRSESWILNRNENLTAITLCHDEKDEIGQIHILMHSFDSPEDCEVEIEARWELISLKIGEKSAPVTVNPQNPVTFLIDHTTSEDWDRKNRYVLNVETTEKYDKSQEICMIVAVYNKECPLHNRPNNVKGAEMWTTALKSATLTIRADKFCFKNNFYVSVVVLPDDYECSTVTNHGDFCRLSSANGTRASNLRLKEVEVKISAILPYRHYLTPILFVIVVVVFLITVSCIIISTKSYGGSNIELEEVNGTGNAKNENEEFISASDSIDGPTKLTDTDAAYDFCTTCSEKVGLRRDDSTKKRIGKGLNRLKDHATLSDNLLFIDDVWFRRSRSKVYLYLVPLISIFYFVPAIQFAFQAKETEEMTGSMDVCYHNYKCARPWWIFSDFNHVVSNISYVFLGFAFMILAYIKTTKLPAENHPRTDHNSTKGLLQQMSIFYAMGYTLMAQGFFSVCYHVCPTNLSLQFDTTMMYMICLLCFVKIYQFRHPDATASGFSTMGLLGLVVLLEALALYSSSWIVYGIFLAIYMAMTVFIAFDCYYLGIGRSDYLVALALAKDIVSNWKPVRNPTPQDEVDASRIENLVNWKPGWVKYPRRLTFALIFVLINVIHAIYIINSKMKNPDKNVTHVVLNILAGNLILYLVYYLARKKCCGVCCCLNCKPQEADYENIGQCLKSFLWSPGTFFTVSSLIFGAIAIAYYVNRSANRNLTPAQSRDLNTECSFFDFYDYHDMWHLFSASGIFMAFMALLTMDDDLLDVPRDRIDVF